MVVSSFVIGLFNIPTSDNQNTNIELFKQAPIIQSLCAIIFAPIIEELVFRHSFRKFTSNPIIFALTTGLIFGFVHITSSLTSLKDLIMFVHLIPYSAVGIAFGYAYKKNNDNIIGTMLIHSIHNIIAVIEILVLL
jgi:membrane protease YdiL (CAAX protease family)